MKLITSFKLLFYVLSFLCLGSFLVHSQNKYPTTKNSSVVIDGGQLLMNKPFTTGGWARGIRFRSASGTTIIGGVGMLGAGNAVSNVFLAHGPNPWSSKKGVYVAPNGRVGIGTTAPLVPLEIRGNTTNSKLILGTGLNSASTQTALEFRHRYGVAGFTNGQVFAAIRSLRSGSSGTASLIFSTASSNSTHASEKMRILPSGNIGIGTRNPGSYKLAVNGKVRAKEVVVETGWSDFVFEADYNLRSLEEVAQHISKHGHLPEIPSAEEVAKNGVKLGEMDSKLLMKIEELTLYLLEQEQKINTLQQEIKRISGNTASQPTKL